MSETSEQTLTLHRLYKCFDKLGGERSLHFDSRLNPEIYDALQSNISRQSNVKPLVCGVLGKDVEFHFHISGEYSLANVHPNITRRALSEHTDNYGGADSDVDQIKAHIISAMLKDRHCVSFTDKAENCVAHVPMEILLNYDVQTRLKAWNSDLTFGHSETSELPEGETVVDPSTTVVRLLIHW